VLMVPRLVCLKCFHLHSVSLGDKQLCYLDKELQGIGYMDRGVSFSEILGGKNNLENYADMVGLEETYAVQFY